MPGRIEGSPTWSWPGRALNASAVTSSLRCQLQRDHLSNFQLGPSHKRTPWLRLMVKVVPTKVGGDDSALGDFRQLGGVEDGPVSGDRGQP